MSNESKKAIHSLINMAAESHDSANAMRYSQAALNAANALAVERSVLDAGIDQSERD